MTGQMSRAQRREACVQVAEEMIDRPEVWYDAHPDGSFGEVEQQARQERRKFMGQVLEILVNGRVTEFRLQGSAASAVGAR